MSRSVPVTVSARIINGALFLDDRSAFETALRDQPDGAVCLRIWRPHSRKADRYYFGVVLRAVSEATGYTAAEAHEVMKRECNPKIETRVDRDGQVVDQRVMGGSITELPDSDMSAYVDRVRQFLAETFGVVVPDPDPTMVSGVRERSSGAGPGACQRTRQPHKWRQSENIPAGMPDGPRVTAPLV